MVWVAVQTATPPSARRSIGTWPDRVALPSNAGATYPACVVLNVRPIRCDSSRTSAKP